MEHVSICMCAHGLIMLFIILFVNIHTGSFAMDKKDDEELFHILTELDNNGKIPDNETEQEESQTMGKKVTTNEGEEREEKVLEMRMAIRMESNECTQDGIVVDHKNDAVVERDIRDVNVNHEWKEESLDFDSNGVHNRMNLTYYSELLQSISKAMSLVSSKKKSPSCNCL